MGIFDTVDYLLKAIFFCFGTNKKPRASANIILNKKAELPEKDDKPTDVCVPFISEILSTNFKIKAACWLEY